MTLLYTHSSFLDHDTGPHHPERAERLVQVYRHLERTKLGAQCRHIEWQPATPEDIQRVHQAMYVHQLQTYVQHGGGRIESDTVVCDRSYDVALLAAGAVTDAVRMVVDGQDKTALCLVRPPGHHALAAGAMGFCLFNNVAVGTRLATRQLGLNRVLIVDWDVHHGNGTQASFWEDPQVGFLSIHRWPFYPGTGWSDETGAGPGAGTICNVPVEFGTSRESFRAQFTSALERQAARLRPELVMVSAGFDAHYADPVGSLGLETEDYQPLSQAVLAIADQYAGGKLVSVLEGGYNTSALAGCVEVHLRELLAHGAKK